MVSFGVIFLYTNNTLIDALKDCINNGDQFARKTAIPQAKYLDLVNLVLTTTWYNLNSHFYQQTDGIAMGSPVSPNTAEI